MNFRPSGLLYRIDRVTNSVVRAERLDLVCVGDRAIRKLARDVAKDWKWATSFELPDIPENDTLWRLRKRAEPAHPLWLALDASGVCLDWGAVRVLTNYARGKYPSARGGVGLWDLDSNVFTDAPR